ncbi:hypothetical protein [Nocardioides sp. B-3]|uniref:hypothetical protein n=1 Tax=Nocardioides sp. B-3 TaxID=2895565 RepID=UPI00215207AD|nr:hypothetical protein [Nocardioides sp. B-3]UUZ59580.1 hypothetical protein LP418_28105 [Nocardioides sp. B-3]
MLQPALQRLDGRVRVQIPLTRALAAFAEEFEDSSADPVVAALILNSKLRGPGLGGHPHRHGRRCARRSTCAVGSRRAARACAEPR